MGLIGELPEDWEKRGKEVGIRNTEIIDQNTPLFGHRCVPLLFSKKDIVQKKPQKCIIFTVLRINHLVVLKAPFQ